jgi:hypothetical protein
LASSGASLGDNLRGAKYSVRLNGETARNANFP